MMMTDDLQIGNKWIINNVKQKYLSSLNNQIKNLHNCTNGVYRINIVYKLKRKYMQIISVLIMSSDRQMFDTLVDLIMDYTYRTCICHDRQMFDTHVDLSMDDTYRTCACHVCYNKLIDIIGILASVFLPTTHVQCGICISTMHGHSCKCKRCGNETCFYSCGLKLYCRYLYTWPCMINHIWGLKQL